MCNHRQNNNNEGNTNNNNGGAVDVNVSIQNIANALFFQFPSLNRQQALDQARNIVLMNQQNDASSSDNESIEMVDVEDPMEVDEVPVDEEITEEEAQEVYNELYRLDYYSDEFVRPIQVKNHRTVIQGYVQQGKTKSIINFALKILVEKKMHVFIVIDNYTTILQSFMERFQKRINENFTPRMIHKYSIEKPDLTDYVINVGKTSEASLKAFLKYRRHPRIFLCMGNKTVLNCLKETYINITTRRPKYFIIIDESDLLSTTGGKRIDSERSKILCEFIHGSFGASRVTATPFSHFIVDHLNTKCSDVKFLPDNDDYVSWGHRKFKVKPFTSDLFMTGKNSELLWTDCMVENYKAIIDSSLNKNDKITIITASIGNLILHSQSVEQKTVELLKNSEVMLTVVRMYGGIIKVVCYHDKDSNEHDLELEEKNTWSLQQHLGFLQDQFTTEEQFNTHRHLILIVGNKQISRGQSLRSEVEHYSSYKDILYCKTYINALSGKLSLDEVLQSVLRCGGIFKEQDNDFDGVCLYTSEDVIEAVNMVLEWQKELKERIQVPANRDKNVREVVCAFISDKRPRNLCSKQRGYIVHEAFVNHYFPTEERLDFLLNGHIYNQDSEDEETVNNNNTTPDEDEHLIRRKFEDYVDSNRCIARFIRNLNPKKIYSKKSILELLDLAGYQQPESILKPLYDENNDYETTYLEKINYRYRLIVNYREIHNEVFGK